MTHVAIALPELPVPAQDLVPEAWYVLTVRPKHETSAAAWLGNRGLDVFHAAYRDRRRWSDRIKEIEVPLFPGYIFCRFGYRERMTVLGAPSVISIVSRGPVPAAVSDDEVEAVRAIIASGKPAMPWRYPAVGMKVRVVGGCLAGLVGRVAREKNACRVVVNVELLQRSVAVEIDHADLLPA